MFRILMSAKNKNKHQLLLKLLNIVIKQLSRVKMLNIRLIKKKRKVLEINKLYTGVYIKNTAISYRSKQYNYTCISISDRNKFFFLSNLFKMYYNFDYIFDM